MQEVTSIEAILERYYIPHHPVLKEDSTTTDLRTVLNAYVITSSGISLNNITLIVQSDLIIIITGFSTHAYIMTADIEQIYHQIYMHQHKKIYN